MAFTLQYSSLCYFCSFANVFNSLFLCFVFVYDVSAENVFVNEDGHIFEIVDNLVDAVSPQTFKESDSPNFRSFSGNDAQLAVVIVLCT